MGETGLIWLDGDGSERGRWVTLAVDPVEQRCSRGGPTSPMHKNPFELLRQLGHGHWCGWLSYEAAAWTEPANPGTAMPWQASGSQSTTPFCALICAHRPFGSRGWTPVVSERMSSWLGVRCSNRCAGGRDRDRSGAMAVAQRSAHFTAGVQRIKDLIAAGDLFQANLTACCSALARRNDPAWISS